MFEATIEIEIRLYHCKDSGETQLDFLTSYPPSEYPFRRRSEFEVSSTEMDSRRPQMADKDSLDHGAGCI